MHDPDHTVKPVVEPVINGGDKINPGDTPQEVPVTPAPEVPPPE